MSVKQQEYKFVEWSKGVSHETYDVAGIVCYLKTLDNKTIRVADIGGGIGSVGHVLVNEIANLFVDVVDNSELAWKGFIMHERVHLLKENFFNWRVQEEYDAVLFRTVLHHFVGASSVQTFSLQNAAIAKAGGMLARDGVILVTENFYEPIISSDITGEIIYQMTRLKAPARLFRFMGANTAGEGVRFRSFSAWQRIFRDNGFEISDEILKQQWDMPIWQRLPLLCMDRYQALLRFQRVRA